MDDNSVSIGYKPNQEMPDNFGQRLKKPQAKVDISIADKAPSSDDPKQKDVSSSVILPQPWLDMGTDPRSYGLYSDGLEDFESLYVLESDLKREQLMLNLTVRCLRMVKSELKRVAKDAGWKFEEDTPIPEEIKGKALGIIYEKIDSWQGGALTQFERIAQHEKGSEGFKTEWEVFKEKLKKEIGKSMAQIRTVEDFKKVEIEKNNEGCHISRELKERIYDPLIKEKADDKLWKPFVIHTSPEMIDRDPGIVKDMFQVWGVRKAYDLALDNFKVVSNVVSVGRRVKNNQKKLKAKGIGYSTGILKKAEVTFDFRETVYKKEGDGETTSSSLCQVKLPFGRFTLNDLRFGYKLRSGLNRINYDVSVGRNYAGLEYNDDYNWDSQGMTWAFSVAKEGADWRAGFISRF